MCHRGVKVLRKPNSVGMGAGVLSSSLPLMREAVKEAGGWGDGGWGRGRDEEGLKPHKGPSWAGDMGQHAVVRST